MALQSCTMQGIQTTTQSPHPATLCNWQYSETVKHGHENTFSYDEERKHNLFLTPWVTIVVVDVTIKFSHHTPSVPGLCLCIPRILQRWHCITSGVTAAWAHGRISCMLPEKQSVPPSPSFSKAIITYRTEWNRSYWHKPSPSSTQYTSKSSGPAYCSCKHRGIFSPCISFLLFWKYKLMEKYFYKVLLHVNCTPSQH